MVTLTTLTQGTATNRLAAGLTRFGLTIPRLGSGWGTPGALDAGALTLAVTGNLTAAWRGTLEAAATGEFRDFSGGPIFAPAAVLRLHPQAAQRLAALGRSRYAAGGMNPRPMPVAMLVRNTTYQGPPFRHEAGEQLMNGQAGGALTGTISFHDSRGLPICPVAVAAMFSDLMGAFPALRAAPAALGPVLALASGTGVHLVDPHGRALDDDALARLTVGNAAATDAIFDWPAGQTMTPAAGVRIGFAAGGRLGGTALSAPALPNGIGRQFVRIVVADLAWHLLGNRTQTMRANIPADDVATPADLLPTVHSSVGLTLLPDGPAMLAAATAVAARTVPAQPGQTVDGMGWLVSPVVETAIGAVAAPWPPLDPALPAGATAAAPLATNIAVTAEWSGTGSDIVLRVPGAGLPAMGHVRAYPRRFQRIGAIGNTPSFVRGDGGAAPIPAVPPPPPASIAILLPNPFALAPGQQPQPDPVLAVDLVVVDRAGRRVTKSLHAVPVTAATGPAPADPWGATDSLDGWAAGFRSVAPSTLFAAPRPPPGPPAATAPSTDAIVKAVRKLAQETVPRVGPHLPTMTRFDTIVATGTRTDPAAAYTWEAVLTGGRWARETRSALHALGNPGQPAGPDVHAPGLHATGPIAFELTRHTMKRALPILPLLGTPAGAFPGWLLPLATAAFAPPAEAAPVPAPAASFSAAMLTTVAAFCDTPELTLLEEPQGPLTLQNFADRVADKFGVAHQPVNQSQGLTTALVEARREMVRARKGSRDAAFSLVRALGQASELIYLEGPAFGATRYPLPDAPPDAAEPADPPETPDLLAAIAQAMLASPAVRLIVAVSREADFAADRPTAIAQAVKSRNAAIDWLGGQFPGRVAVFHPVGFPGRPARLKTSIAIVDDVFALIGTSHFRRRGHSFDGGVDVALIDDDFADGHSVAIRAFRRALLAAKLSVVPPLLPLTAGSMPGADWDRIATPRGAFDFVAGLLKQGGLGRIKPPWRGSDDPTITADPPRQADPNGMGGATATLALASLLSSLDQP